MLKKLIEKYFDYDIVGDYLDNDGKGHMYRRYNKRYYLKCLRKKRGGRKL